MSFKVVEIFESINGEGMRAGELAVFVRMKCCNLSCNYCDTMWANKPDCEFEEMTAEQIVDRVKKIRHKKCDIDRRRAAFTERCGQTA